MTEEITEAIRNAFNEYLNAVDKVILENEALQIELQRLEQENKELKEKKDKYYQQTLDDEILMNELSLEVDLRKKESDFYLEKLSKYRSALEEIKSIADKFDYWNNNLPEASEIIGEVKDKINEVLGNEMDR